MQHPQPGRAGRALGAALVIGALASAQNWLTGARVLTELDQYGANDEYGYFIARGDVDFDGDQDLVAHVTLPGPGPLAYALRTFLNQGNGELALGPLSPLATFYETFGLPVLDVTADGIGDLVLRRASSFGPLPTLEVYRGTGGGAFTGPMVVPSGGNALGVAVGDSDSDGHLDLALWHTALPNYHVRTEWWRYDGAGFSPSAFVTLSVDLDGPYAAGIAAFDADLDGDDDIAITQGTAGGAFELRVLTTVHGNPTDTPPIGLGSAASVAPRASDLDGDGDEDLLLYGFASSNPVVSVVDNQGGALQIGPTLPLSGGASTAGAFLDLGDWDGDGDVDVFTSFAAPATSPTNTLPALGLIRNEGGSFEIAGYVPTFAAVAGAGPADYDGDGRLDWAASKAIAFGDALFREILPVVKFYNNTEDFTAFDWEGDGDLDLAELRGGIYVNDGNAVMSEAVFALPATTPPFSYDDGAGLADFDGDGWEDLLTGYFTSQLFVPVFLEMRLLAGTPGGKFADHGSAAAFGVKIPGPTSGSDLVVDLDQDGDLDLLRGTGCWLNSGSGTFAFTPVFGTGSATAWGDADADGDPDVLGGVPGPGNLLGLQRNQGGLSFTAETIASGVGGATAVLLDIDGDGDDDVFAETYPTPASASVQLIPSLGASFGAPIVLASQAQFGRTAAVDDLDGDGLGDLLVSGRPQKNLTSPIYRMAEAWCCLGGFAYEPARAYVGPETEGYSDLDQDGDLEAWGSAVLEVRRKDGPADGEIGQYGTGLAGTGGIVPVVGGSGPLQPGSTAGIHVRRGRGGALAFFAIGTQQVALADVPLLGFTTYVSPLLYLVTVPLGGTPGAPGEGTYDFDVSGLLGIVAGQTYTHQFAILDPAAPLGLSSTNGLVHRYGL